ncbi:MAG: ParB/RepB/Spo0J family partition protein [Burkholderiales bacterium]|nr:ParB/RepB/Spo0J family partition protein [Burkholderiales bacterium]
MLRLRPIQLDLDALQSVGGPLLIRIADIDEDPDQPRVEFEDESLKELATTIAERGVRSPVSVRPHPTSPGRWLLNYGARRLRAAKLAGLTELPAFEDKSADSYDQVIENEQREGLKPLELALFVKRRLDKGDSQAEIARRLGKSQTYLTFVRAMIDPPPWLMEVYRSGKCRNAAQLYELRRLHETDPEGVEERVDSLGRVGSGDIERLKKGDDVAQPEALGGRLSQPEAKGEGPGAQRPIPYGRSFRTQPNPKGRLVLTAKYMGTEVRVQLGALPSNSSSVYVMSRENGEQATADIHALTELKISRLPA